MMGMRLHRFGQNVYEKLHLIGEFNFAFLFSFGNLLQNYDMFLSSLESGKLVHTFTRAPDIPLVRFLHR